MTLSIMLLCCVIYANSNVMRARKLALYADCHYVEWHYAEFRHAESHGAPHVALV